MKATIHPLARVDLLTAAEFYQQKGSAALAARFVAEFQRQLQILVRQPGLGSPRSKGRRAFVMSRFPYTIVYRQQEDGIFVLVLKHNRKRPNFGGART